MLILPGNLTDLNAFLRIEQETFPVDGYDLPLLRKYVKNAMICLKMVIEQTQEIIGSCLCTRLSNEDIDEDVKNGVELASLAILPSYQGKGFGTQFMQRVMTDLSGFNIDYIELQVDTSNGSAIHLYENFGFQILDTLSHYYNNSGHDAFVMVWRKMIS